MAYVSTVNSRSDETAENGWCIAWAIRFALLLSTILIMAAARGDLWLDEIWSIAYTRYAHSAADIFFRFRYDNNHPLNTLYLYLMGEQNIFLLYRLPAVLSGIGSLFLIVYIAMKEWGYREALCSILLAGISFPLLLYFSEARGYAPEIFFALACYVLLHRNLQDFTIARMILFWIFSVLGVLSHSTFIIAAVGFIIGNLTEAFSNEGSRHRKFLHYIAYHVPPFIFYAWWYMFFLKDMVIGGGPIYRIWDITAQTATMLLGLPEGTVFSFAALCCVFLLITVGVFCLYRERNPRWLFFLTVLTFSPAVIYISSHPVVIYFRYFIVCFPFFYLLSSYLICKCCDSRPEFRILVIVALLAVLASGHARRDYQLLKTGRGQYRAALEYIAQTSPGAINIGSDHDFRNLLIFDFYTRLMPGGNRLHYKKNSEWIKEPPDWIITHSQNPSYHSPHNIIINRIWRYRFITEYRSAEVSGFNWFLFRREAGISR
jgi:hypothetical protein